MSRFVPQHTPEAAAALLGRHDSKNAARTCNGITSAGRPCRRAIAVAPSGSPTTAARRRSSQTGDGGVVALVQQEGARAEADFYCWQHQDQAAKRVQSDSDSGDAENGRKVQARRTELFPLQETSRSSIDTLVQRLGLASDDQGRKHPASSTHEPTPPRRTDTHDFANRPARLASQAPPYRAKYAREKAESKPKPKPREPPGFWESLCCMGQQDDDYVEMVRHKRRTHQARPTFPPHTVVTSPGRSSSRPPCRPPPHHRSSSNPQTTTFLELIPPHLTPPTTSALLAELIKPVSAAADEGYIYIFWLTPPSTSAPAEDTARSLLSPSSTRPADGRRVSDVMSDFSHHGPRDRAGGSTETIMLKIGRANNVTRRMNEWQRQCGYALNLVRWYPHVPSSPVPSPARPAAPRHSSSSGGGGGGVRKVQYVKRVERLIHLEMQDRQVRRQCETCGKEHREWFEVEASQAGVRAVDECVRRWVGWAEGQVEKS